MSLQNIRKRKADPTQNFPPITVKVVQLKKTTKVTKWEVSEGTAHAQASHDNVTAAVTDGQSVMKFILFENLANQIREGHTYIIKGYGCSRFGGQCLLTRQDTKIFRALNPLQVAPELEDQARTLLTPVSPKIDITEINSDVVDLVTVQGIVTSVSFCPYYHKIYEHVQHIHNFFLLYGKLKPCVEIQKKIIFCLQIN